MPLSISSSNQRIPRAPYGRLWILALILMLVFFAVGEILLSKVGFMKSVADDKVLWGMELDVREAKPTLH